MIQPTPMRIGNARRRRRNAVAVCISVSAMSMFGSNVAHADDADIRDRYGTRNLKVAKAIDRAIKLSAEQKNLEALKALEKAARLDPACDFAMYWKGIVLHDLGRVEESIKSYESAYTLARKSKSVIEMEASFNLGLTLGMLERYEESDRWLSRSFLADPTNRFGRQAAALRNLSVNAVRRGRFLCASLRAAYAREIDPAAISHEQVLDMAKRIGLEEAAQLVTTDEKVTVILPRPRATELTPIEFDTTVIGQPIDLILSDAGGGFVLALPQRGKEYFVVHCADDIHVNQVSTTGAILAADVRDGYLYLSLGGPPRIIQCQPETGEEIQVLLQGAERASSIAVMPNKRRVFYTADNRLYELDMDRRTRSPRDKSATLVAADRTEKYLFTLFRNRRPSQFVEFIIDGQPVSLRVDSGNQQFDPLSQFVVGESSLLFTGFRSNAGWNSSRLVVSPDGDFVSVVAGGGWRPRSGHEGGYGIPVFDAHDVQKLHGFFSTDIYPRGIAINPVTHQIAAITEKYVRVFDLASTDQSIELPGEFNGACAWTGDGSKLVLGTKSGISIFGNALSKSETRLAKKLARANARKTARAKKRSRHQTPILPENFALRDDLSAVKSALLRGLASGRDVKPASWRSFEEGDVNGHRDAARVIDALPKDAGLRIYRLRQALEKQKHSTPLQLELAGALAESGLHDEAQLLFLKVIRSDRGITDLSLEATIRLAAMLAAQGRRVQALDCAAAGLRIDRANPVLRKLARDIATSLDQEDLVLQIDKASGAEPASTATASQLPRPRGDEPKLSAEEIYVRSVNAVVGIRSAASSGTGFFISNDGLVVSCAHVVPPGRREARVLVYGDESETRKAPRDYSATVEFRDDTNDILVLRVAKHIEHTKPLILMDNLPKVGARVFAIGHPRLGESSLPYSLTDGLISADEREFGGRKYLQHTAAIGSGSSGSPLLNERGLVVGMVALKAGSKETGFAIPARQICEAVEGHMR